MSNVRVLTGGLVLIVLGLAGGTGWLIYERIQSEVTTDKKVTMQEFEETKEAVEKAQKDVGELKESDKVQSAKISVLEEDMATAQYRLDQQDKVIKKLEEDTTANREDIDMAKAEREKLAESLTEVKDELEAAKKERQAIRDQLKAQGERIDEQEERISELESKDDAHDEELAALREELAELKRQLGLEGDQPES